MSIWLRFQTPPENFVHDLAPRVEGKGQYVGNYGYAVCLTRDAIRVMWDDGGWDDVSEQEIVFLNTTGGTPG